MKNLTQEEIQIILDALSFYGDYLCDDEDLAPKYKQVQALELKIERGL